MTGTSDMPGSSIVVAIDGPSGAGKGTIARHIARRLGFHFLDSGAVYRAAALGCVNQNIDLSDDRAATLAVRNMVIGFSTDQAGSSDLPELRVTLADRDVTAELRSETAADAASRIAVLPGVRDTLLTVQRDFLQSPGLVADGRDMGTVVFPDAQVKVFMTANPRIRAERRLQQLKQHGIEATLGGLMQEIEQRDLRDSTRRHAPLLAANDAMVIDTSDLDIEAAVERVLAHTSEMLGDEVPGFSTEESGKYRPKPDHCGETAE